MAESTQTLNRWIITRKAAVVLELLCGGEAVGVARRRGLSQVQLFTWRDRFLEGGQTALRTRRGQINSEQERQVRELERKVGQLIVEKWAVKKTDGLIRQRGRRLSG